MSDKDPFQLARAIVAGLPDAAVLLDRHLKPVQYNTVYVNLTGYRHRELKQHIDQGGSVFDLISQSPSIDRENAKLCIADARTIHLAEVPVSSASGRSLTVHQTFIPVMAAGNKVEGVIVTLRDVSAEVRMQGAYKELLAQERARADDLERQVAQRTAELSAALEEVTRLSLTDPLTRVLNRRAFTEHAEQALTVARRHSRVVGLMMCDLDFFKKLNDTYGHQGGDAMLISVANTLGKTVRDADKVARFGGEEFVVLLTETDPAAVINIANRCCQAIAELPAHEIVPQMNRSQTVSIGVAIFPEHGGTLDELIGLADKALYRAKQNGRNQVVVYDPQLALTQVEVKSSAKPSLRVLIVDEDATRLEQYRNTAVAQYEVIPVSDTQTALALCAHQPFDVVIADQGHNELSGVEFLLHSLPHLPGALRILFLDTQDVFLAIRGTNQARVDHFLLRSDGSKYLMDAIDDGLLRREILRSQLRRGGHGDGVVHLSNVELHNNEIDRLIATRALRFNYQPIISALSGKVVAYEALCRFDSTVFDAPEALFDAALRAGKIWDIGRLVREVAVAPLPKLPASVALFVNLHPAELRDPTLLTHELLNLQQSNRIVFEITERSAIPDLAFLVDHVQQLRGSGYRFAVDDLGAGYASLNSVALLGPDFVKIDHAMMRDLHNSTRRSRLIRRIVEFANEENIKVIGEGIETAEEAQRAIELGCHLLQGYYFGRPAPLD